MLLSCGAATAADGFDAATFDDPQFEQHYTAEDGQLQRKLLQQADANTIPFLRAELMAARDPLRQQLLLGLLAACGPEAMPVLDEYYAWLEVRTVAPAPGPFVLPPSPPLGRLGPIPACRPGPGRQRRWPTGRGWRRSLPVTSSACATFILRLTPTTTAVMSRACPPACPMSPSLAGTRR